MLYNGAALHLMKVILGQSVSQIKKAASANPSLYRPVILHLIQKPAESNKVRIAALTVLPYSYTNP